VRKREVKEFQPQKKTLQFLVIGNRYAKVHGMKLQNDKNRKSGQVMLEYVVAFGIFLVLVGLSAMLLYAFKSFGGRVISLMASYV
jgi:hypothetical protein